MSPRVLIIDDEAEIRRNLTFGLTQEGFSCTSCPDGISAIHELYNAREQNIGYDYLISDIFMPDIDGLKILKVIKSEFPEVPVLIITGFGNEELEATALAEQNTGFLDKPFEISELVDALKKLNPGATTLDSGAVAKEADVEIKESISSYITIRVSDVGRDMDIYNQLYSMKGVVTCDAVHGDVDIIVLAQASSEAEMGEIHENIKAIEGLVVVSLSQVERVKLDKDVKEFIGIYKKAVKEAVQKDMPKISGNKSYVIVDIDKSAIQQIFATLFFLDEVIFCDVIDDGSKLIGIVHEAGAFGKTPKVVEKLSQIDGVLRVKESKIIKLRDDN